MLLYDIDSCGNDFQLFIPFTGNEEPAARDSLCSLDRNRSSGRRDRWNRAVQRASYSGEDLLCGSAAHWDRGAESDIQTLSRRFHQIKRGIRKFDGAGMTCIRHIRLV